MRRPCSFGSGIAFSWVESINAMKITLIVLCLFCATAAFGQVAVGAIPSQAQPLRMVDHPEHASQHDLAEPQNILHDGGYSYAKGERPLWEFGPMTEPVPLGDVARAYRQEHALAKKAEVVFEKYVPSK
jgi:hypothetical protein